MLRKKGKRESDNATRASVMKEIAKPRTTGKHHIKIELPGYRSFETDITVEANQKVTVKTELAKASIAAEGSDLNKDESESQPHR